MLSSEAAAMIANFGSRPAPTSSEPANYPEMRTQTDTMVSTLAPLPSDMNTEEVMIAGRAALWLTPAGSDEGRALLYLHGGGYVTGGIVSHRELAARIATAANCRALVLDYRLAPESQCPAALDDVLATYEYLLDSGFEAGQVAIAGDSAGGGLTVAALVSIRDRGLPLPSAAVLISPWADLTLSGDSMSANASIDPLLKPDVLGVWAGLYAGQIPLSDPRTSPLYADLRGLPPMYISVGSEEILLSDSQRLTAKLRESDVAVDMTVTEGLFHCFELFPLYPEAFESTARMGAFLKANSA